jgi:hypothetical protein
VHCLYCLHCAAQVVLANRVVHPAAVAPLGSPLPVLPPSATPGLAGELPKTPLSALMLPTLAPLAPLPAPAPALLTRGLCRAQGAHRISPRYSSTLPAKPKNMSAAGQGQGGGHAHRGRWEIEKKGSPALSTGRQGQRAPGSSIAAAAADCQEAPQAGAPPPLLPQSGGSSRWESWSVRSSRQGAPPAGCLWAG